MYSKYPQIRNSLYKKQTSLASMGASSIKNNCWPETKMFLIFTQRQLCYIISVYALGWLQCGYSIDMINYTVDYVLFNTTSNIAHPSIDCTVI